MRQLPQGGRPQRNRVRWLLEEGRRRVRAHHQGAVLQGAPASVTFTNQNQPADMDLQSNRFVFHREEEEEAKIAVVYSTSREAIVKTVVLTSYISCACI